MTIQPEGRAARHKQRLLIFVVAYNAERTVEKVLSRIPPALYTDEQLNTEVLIIDDASEDKTFEKGHHHKLRNLALPITILQNPVNLGYGGNQKVGYRYAIDNGFDFVALIHGDGQYAPEELPNLLRPLLRGECDAVFGSRMLAPGEARRGGMPLYKYVGNKILTWMQNRIVGTRLSEYHSGYRLYSCAALAMVPFEVNSDGFPFDTDIIIQLHVGGFRMVELPVPTFYGDEICHVNGVQYAAAIIWTSILSRIQRLGLLYDPRFDLAEANEHYRPKYDFPSSHSLALQWIDESDSLLLVGSGPRALVEPFAERSRAVTAIDLYVDPDLDEICDAVIAADLNSFDFDEIPPGEPPAKVLALDIIEHLTSPEDFLRRLRSASCLEGAEYMFTTANVGFLPVRLMLLFGAFNYGKSGILDRTHTRLFTFSSLRRLFQQAGFDVSIMRGIPAPFPLALGRSSRLGRLLLRANVALIRLSRGAFSYQIMAVARPRPTVGSILRRTLEHSESRAATLATGRETRVDLSGQ
jgi:glycosyltransferase involved in cell wall biosynthesis